MNVAGKVLDALVESGAAIKRADKTGRVWYSVATESEAVALVAPDPGRRQVKARALPPEWAPPPEMRDQLKAELGITDALFDAHLTYFRDYAAARGATYKDWNAAFRNAVRGDWGDVRKKWKPGAAAAAMPGLANW